MKLTLDCVFAELHAPDADSATSRVAEALRAINEPQPEELTALADPESGRWGVEITLSNPRVSSPQDAWQLGHALAGELGDDARVEPCFRSGPSTRTDESSGDDGGGPDEVTWHLRTMRVAEAHDWLRTQGIALGAGVTIGHPDTGYTEHPDIWGGMAGPTESGGNLLELGPAIDPWHQGLGLQPGHGTRTASVMVARPGVGVARVGSSDSVDLCGIAPAATVRAYRVTDSVIIVGWGRRLARSIEAAVDDRCAVISMSLGGLGGARLDRAIRYAEERGVTVVAAAGNYVPWVVAPASHPLVIACAASDWEDRPWRFSAQGPAVDITAPGQGVWVAGWRDDVPVAERSSGTSYATAAVAAAAALWRCAHARALARIHASEHAGLFRSALRASARRVTALPDADFGAGVLDCLALVQQPLRRRDTEAMPLAVRAGDAELRAILGAAAAIHEPTIAALDDAERAELAFQLGVDAAARAAWREPNARAVMPAGATRRLRVALRRVDRAEASPR